MPHAVQHLPEWFGELTGRTRSHIVLSLIVFLMLVLSLAATVEVKNEVTESRMENSKHVVEVATNAIWGYFNAAQSGKITNEQAKVAAITMLSSMHYDKLNYVFGLDYKSHPGKITMLMSRFRPDLVGKDVSEQTSTDGVQFIKAAYNVAKTGGGYYSYMFDGFGTMLEARKKINYVMAFEPWGWVIGTGSYYDDIIIHWWDDIAFVLSLFAAILTFGTSLIDWIYKQVGR